MGCGEEAQVVVDHKVVLDRGLEEVTRNSEALAVVVVVLDRCGLLVLVVPLLRIVAARG